MAGNSWIDGCAGSWPCHIDHLPVAIAPLIDAGLGRNVTRLGSEEITGVAEQRCAVRIHVLWRLCMTAGTGIAGDFHEIIGKMPPGSWRMALENRHVSPYRLLP